MASLKDFSKLVNGLSLVAKEVMRRGHLDNPDLQSLIRQALLSATDISGLTKGEVRNFTITAPKANADTNGFKEDSSVVYFGEQEEEAPSYTSAADNVLSPTPSDQSIPREADFDPQRPSPSTIKYKNGNVHADARINHSLNAGKIGNGESETLKTETIIPPATLEGIDAAATAAVEEGKAVPPPPIAPPLVKKQRRRKERKVPSTPFSRALGWVV